MTNHSYYQKNKNKFSEKYQEHKEKLRADALNYYHNVIRKNSARYLLKKAKERAKKKGLDFSICLDDITVPEVCPVFGTLLVMGKGRPTLDSPTLDRINNELGYIKGNVVVISNRANRLKSDMTIRELRQFAKWIIDISTPET